jgi:hypothetical protein
MTYDDLAPDQKKLYNAIDGGYIVERADGTALTVFPREAGVGGWAVYFSTATIRDRRPCFGIAGSASASAEAAIEWALR